MGARVGETLGESVLRKQKIKDLMVQSCFDIFRLEQIGNIWTHGVNDGPIVLLTEKKRNKKM